MSISTEHTPTGTLNTPDEVFVAGGPDFYFGGEPQHAPDVNGFHYGIVGTTELPVYRAGCYTDFELSSDLTVNEIRCDTQGTVGDIMRINFLEVTFNLQALFPLNQLAILLRWSSTLQDLANDVEYAGIGEINQQDFHKVFFSRIYDPDAGDYVSFTGHRAQFRWDGTIGMAYDSPWAVGVVCRLYADQSKPSAQRFATVVRYDPSLL